MKLRRLDDAGLLAGGVEERGRDRRAERRAASASAAQGRRLLPCRRQGAHARRRRPGEAGERLEVERDVAGRLEPLLRVLLQAVANDPVETRVDVLVRRREIRRLLRQDRRDRVGRRVPAEGALAREHLVQDRPEGEEVRPLVRGLPPHLLGRHVAHRPEHDAGLRAAGDGAHVRLSALVLLGLELREPEVEDLDPAVLRQEKVLGLQVPVHDPLLVRRREPAGDLDGVVDRLAHRERTRQQSRPQRFPFEELRDDVRGAVVRAEVVDRGDAGVVQHAGGPRFLLEALEPVRVLRESRGQNLDRHVAPKARILRPVDLPHPPSPDRRQDLVRPELRTGGERHFKPSTR